MDQDSHSDTRDKLYSQVREAYGKVVYTCTCHNHMENRFTSRDTWMRITQIILSVVSPGSLLISINSSECPDRALFTLVIGILASLLTIVITTYMMSFCCADKATSHRKTADALWRVREDYISLLTDFDCLDDATIRQRRDALSERTAEIYELAPRTDKRAYNSAQKALKIEEEQTFSEAEIDNLLPISLRNVKE